MKAFFCKECNDMRVIVKDNARTCQCGKSTGYYKADTNDAVVIGPAVPIWITILHLRWPCMVWEENSWLTLLIPLQNQKKIFLDLTEVNLFKSIHSRQTLVMTLN